MPKITLQTLSDNWHVLAAVVAAAVVAGSMQSDVATAKADIARIDANGTTYGLRSQTEINGRLGRIEANQEAQTRMLERLMDAQGLPKN